MFGGAASEGVDSIIPVLLVFHIGEQCTHRIDQLNAIKDRFNEFSAADCRILAVSSDPPEANAESEVVEHFNIPILSDVDHSNARRFRSDDDFEELELHSTILIDRDGRVRWSRNGGDPFMTLDFIFSDLKRIETIEFTEQDRADSAPIGAGSPQTRLPRINSAMVRPDVDLARWRLPRRGHSPRRAR